MKSTHRKIVGLAGGLVALTALSACHDNDAAAPAPPATTTQNFSAFAKTTFAADENSTPVNFDGLTLVADVDNDPTAFDSLLM